MYRLGINIASLHSSCVIQDLNLPSTALWILLTLCTPRFQGNTSSNLSLSLQLALHCVDSKYEVKVTFQALLHGKCWCQSCLAATSPRIIRLCPQLEFLHSALRLKCLCLQATIIYSYKRWCLHFPRNQRLKCGFLPTGWFEGVQPIRFSFLIQSATPARC